MKRALITIFLFGAALFGSTSLLSAHPGHGGGPGHSHGHSHVHGHSHGHGGVIIRRGRFGSPFHPHFGRSRIIRHRGHLHRHHGHFHGRGSGLRIRTGGFSFGIRF